MPSIRRPFPRLLIILAVLATGCGPTAGPSPSAVPTVASEAPIPSTSEPSPPGTIGGSCPIPPTTGALPSNTLTGLAVEALPTADRMTFTFGEPADIPTEPVGRLRAVQPPFTHAASGNPITVVGDHFLEVVFTGMWIADEEGNPTFQGQRDARWGLAAIKHSVMFDESEGQVGFIVGYVGDGCVALGGDPEAGTVTIEIAAPLG